MPSAPSGICTFACCLLAIAMPGAIHAASQPAEQAPTAAHEPATTQPAVVEIPVIYSPRLSPEKLTQANLESLVAEARSLAPPGSSIWFLHVLFSRGDDSRVNVFYTPDQTSGRLQRGKCVLVGPEITRTSETVRRIIARFPASQRGQFDQRLVDYYRVLTTDAKEACPRSPSEDSTFPFIAPKGFTDDEIIRIVDFVRTNPIQKFPPNTLPQVEIFFGAGRPIVRITRENKVIKVFNGSQEGPLSGSGQVLECAPDGDSFKLIRIADWVS